MPGTKELIKKPTYVVMVKSIYEDYCEIVGIYKTEEGAKRCQERTSRLLLSLETNRLCEIGDLDCVIEEAKTYLGEE